MCSWYICFSDSIITEHLSIDFIYSFVHVTLYTLGKIRIYLVIYRIYYSLLFSFVSTFLQLYLFLIKSLSWLQRSEDFSWSNYIHVATFLFYAGNKGLSADFFHLKITGTLWCKASHSYLHRRFSWVSMETRLSN